MKILSLIIFCFAFLILPCTAQAQTAADKTAMQQVVEAQLKAFAIDDGSKAYDFAAPIVKGAFPTVDIFMTMVKRGYRPVYRNSEHRFTSAEPDGLGRPSVRVQLTAEDGKRWEALYTMEKQTDGSWKIAGCILLQIPGTDV